MRERETLFRAPAISLALAVTALVLLIAGLLLDGKVSHRPSDSSAPQVDPASPARQVTVYFNEKHPGRQVARGFLGLSLELASLPQLADDDSHGNLVTLLRSLGPGLLRFGGASADADVAYARLLPAWADTTLEAPSFAQLAKIVRASDWRVMLTLNLGHYSPSIAAAEMTSAASALGHSLAYVSFGNEPDSYVRHRVRPLAWTLTNYLREVSIYRRELEKVGILTPLAGPDVSGSGAFSRWAPKEAAAQHPALLTGHHYPLSCQAQPTIGELLAPKIRAGELAALQRFAQVERETGTPVRVDESGSVSCGGLPGVSDTFAAALWEVDFAARAMASGISGINFHGNFGNCLGYSPLCATSKKRLAQGQLTAQPTWYSLLMDRQLIGDRPLSTKLTTDGANIDALAFERSSNRVQVLVVDEDPTGSGPAKVRIPVTARFRQAAPLWLTAPSPTATSDVALGGASVAASGTWTPTASATPIARGPRGITVTLPPSSAVLLTLD